MQTIPVHQFRLGRWIGNSFTIKGARTRSGSCKSISSVPLGQRKPTAYWAAFTKAQLIVKGICSYPYIQHLGDHIWGTAYRFGVSSARNSLTYWSESGRALEDIMCDERLR